MSQCCVSALFVLPELVIFPLIMEKMKNVKKGSVDLWTAFQKPELEVVTPLEEFHGLRFLLCLACHNLAYGASGFMRSLHYHLHNIAMFMLWRLRIPSPSSLDLQTLLQLRGWEGMKEAQNCARVLIHLLLRIVYISVYMCHYMHANT